jgi:hypothetical protein
MITVADLYMISGTYTVVDPGAMVVVHANASFADIAVFGSRGFNDLTLGAHFEALILPQERYEGLLVDRADLVRVWP